MWSPGKSRSVKTLLLVAAMLAGPGAATARSARPAPRPASAARFAGLADFVDGVMAHAIATRQVAGAVVTVVANGHVLFSRGYGWSDVDGRVPVDPRQTLFHPGSVSKLFTWVALMQQVEQGRVDLDADVNRYIDFKIPPFEGAPVRVRDLLQHSPGFSDVSGVISESQDKVVPYQQWLKTHVPQRLWAPGTEIAYSNYGAALAGYIVERVSGEPYPDYVERHIFRPLAMASTTFREPLPAALAPRMAHSYTYADGRLVLKGPEWLGSVMPAGSSASTGADMARFILALLGNGRLGTASILKPDSVRLLESDSLANAPDLPGMAHGFLVERKAGPRLVGHAGNTIDFHSDLVIAPALGIGYFVSVSGGPESSEARTELSAALTGRLFPQTPTPRWTGPEEKVVAGSYRANRRDYTRPVDPRHDVTVKVAGPHRLTLKVEGIATAWEQVGPRRYELVTGARPGGPFDEIEFTGPADSPRLSFASEPYEAFHYVPAP
jgi:CubicO group peptidase (beta-lactamase class C family)